MTSEQWQGDTSLLVLQFGTGGTEARRRKWRAEFWLISPNLNSIFFFFFFFKCLFLTWYIFRLWRDLNCFKLFLVQQRIVLVYFTSIQINQRNEKRCVWFCIRENKTNNKQQTTNNKQQTVLCGLFFLFLFSMLNVQYWKYLMYTETVFPLYNEKKE